MIRWFVILTIALAPLSAGCIAGDEGAVDAASADPAAEGAPAPVAPQDEQSAPSAEPDAEAEPATFVSRPVDWSGKIGTAYCVPMGPNACVGTVLTDGETWTQLEASTIGGGELTLTWEASSPTSETLRFSIMSVNLCGEQCYSTTSAYSLEVEGTSPLTLSLDATTLPEDQALVLDVDTVRLTPSPVLAYVTLEQPFQVQGELLVPG